VPAIVRTANRWGCQFHPERSAEAGATILRNFLGLPEDPSC
jgi:glutamine amidotransferase